MNIGELKEKMAGLLDDMEIIVVCEGGCIEEIEVYAGVRQISERSVQSYFVISAGGDYSE